jgi:hypothetical protein
LEAPKSGAAGLLKLFAIDKNGRTQSFSRREISIYSGVAKWVKFARSFNG